jgi:hypothetical protein
MCLKHGTSQTQNAASGLGRVYANTMLQRATTDVLLETYEPIKGMCKGKAYT